MAQVNDATIQEKFGTKKEHFTMNVTIFNHPVFGSIRGMEIQGKAWLVGKDIAQALGYAKPLNAIAAHIDEDDSLKQGIIDSMGRTQQTILINESGLYSLVFSSKLPRAKEFRSWVLNDVLPRLHTEAVGCDLSVQTSLFDSISNEKSENTEQKASNMSNITLCKNPEFGSIRGVEINGEAWLVGKDVATALGYVDTDQALRKHIDEEDKLTRQFNGSGQNRDMTVINESGLYSLIFSSKLPCAKKFTRWVTSEVLPSIRKHGAYITPDTLEQMIASPEFGIRLLTALKEEQEKCKKLEADVLLMRPKAEYFDALVDRNLLTNFRDTAKELHTGQKTFVEFLLEKKYVYRGKTGKLLPYQKHADNGLFEIKEVANDESGWAGVQTFITPKGRETFRLLLAV